MSWSRYLFSSRGRLTRAKYWFAAIVFLLVMAAAVMLALMAPTALPSWSLLPAGLELVIGLAFLAVCYSSIVIAIKRLHDRNKSGWWVLIFFGLPSVLPQLADPARPAVTLVLNGASFVLSLWALVELGFLRGTRGPNRFGPDPLESGAHP